MSKSAQSLMLAAAIAGAMLVPLAALRPPPGGGGSTGGGTIFFQPASGPPVWTMNSDGSGKTATLAPFNSVPSRLLHGGQRWYLEMRPINGQFYPTGAERYELFAVRGDGNSAFTVQLTDQPDLEMDLQYPVWLPGDTAISWVARRWDFNTVTVTEGGVYSADLVYDGAGNITGLVSQPGVPTLSRPLFPEGQNGGFSLGGDAPDIGTHDWSPSGHAIVYDAALSGRALWIEFMAGGSSLLDPGPCSNDVWSPGGNLIAFRRPQFGGDEIRTIRTDGTGLTTIITNNGGGSPVFLFRPMWSPTGSHITYSRGSGSILGGTYIEDIYRATNTGAKKTNLTSDIGGIARPLAWR